MEYEEFLAAEHKLHVASDKKYQKHLAEMQALTARQVVAQEALVKRLGEAIDLQLNDPDAKTKVNSKASSEELEKQREATG